MYKFYNLIKGKNLLISIVVLASTIIVTGIGSYAWFTASVAGNGKIQVGTFKLSLDGFNDSDTNKVIFDLGNIEPGVASPEKIVSFSNTGTLGMVLMANLNLSSEDKVLNNGVGNLSAYKVIAKIYKNNDTDASNLIYSSSNAQAGEDISVFNTELNSKLDPQDGVAVVFNSNERLIFRFQLILDSGEARNIHQGDTVNAELKVEARQNVSDSLYTE